MKLSSPDSYARTLVAVVVALVATTACVAARSAKGPEDPFRVAADTARARAEALFVRGGPFTSEDAREVLTAALLDVERFESDGRFRAGVLDVLPAVLPNDAPDALRDRLLYELETGPGLTFEQSEALELAWGAAARSTAARRVPAPASGFSYPDEIERPIAATFFSFPSHYFDPQAPGQLDTLAALLQGVRERAPEREIVVLADLPVHEPLAERTAGLGVHWIESYGRPYSPWPRDPFSTAWDEDGRLVLIERPDLQGGREGDAWMARELVQNLPLEIDAAWGGGGEAGVAWTEAPFFFHNGHVVMAGGAAWTSLHGLERRILEVLGEERVPVESFATAEGIDRYVGAASRVMDEMSAFYGKPVKLVHPLPGPEVPTARRTAEMRAIGGGAGIDLDSIVTFVPAEGGADGLTALVGDLDAGRELLAGLGNDDLRSLRSTYGLAPPPADLRGLLSGATRAHRAAGLDAFLDLSATHLAVSGVAVRRIPLLFVPTTLLEDRARYDHDHFLVGWNNVVLETRNGRATAEGFASGIPAGDAQAREIYRAAGVELTLLPTLTESVKANGGYRCASNQVRAGATRSHPTHSP